MIDKAEIDAKVRTLNGELSVVAREIARLLVESPADAGALAELDARAKELRRRIRQEEDRWIDWVEARTVTRRMN